MRNAIVDTKSRFPENTLFLLKRTLTNNKDRNNQSMVAGSDVFYCIRGIFTKLENKNFFEVDGEAFSNCQNFESWKIKANIY